jgi:2-polyprenyl-3-methyl-5-hydroxy-6-metoxy-1,4-benzoquinol methylase
LEENGYANVCGIDIDASQVEACRQNKLHVTLVDDTIEHLANQTEKYDLITAFDVLEHISPETQIKFLKAVYHALAPAGEIVLTVPNANSILASRNRYIDFTHQAVFTEISLDFVLYNAGFKDILIKPLDFIRFSFSIKYFIHRPLFGFFRFIRRLQMIAELGTTWGKKVPLSFNLIGKARKL